MRQRRGKSSGVTLAAAIMVVAMGGACGGSESKPASNAQVPVESTTVATAGATGATTGAAAAIIGGVRVMILGTSLTAGLGLDPDSAYPAVLQRLADSAGYKVTISAKGLSGETSAGALERVDWLMRDRADVVVLEAGANDGLRGVDPASTKTNLAKIIRKLREGRPGLRVMLAQMEAPPNLGQAYTRDFRDAFMTVARDEQVPLIPFFLDGVAGVSSLNQADGIHPNEEGARRAARNMWKALAPVLREVPGAMNR
ncbi:MAG: arylesterase [Gemmatimonadaceae bacterium]